MPSTGSVTYDICEIEIVFFFFFLWYINNSVVSVNTINQSKLVIYTQHMCCLEGGIISY